MSPVPGGKSKINTSKRTNRERYNNSMTIVFLLIKNTSSRNHISEISIN